MRKELIKSCKKHLIYLFFLWSFFLIISSFALAQNSPWPSYSAVVDTFFNNYDYPFDQKLVRFEKRKDGWYVAEVLHDDTDNGLSRYIFWSAEKGKFSNLPYKKLPIDSGDFAHWRAYYDRNFMDPFTKYQFERNRYYGYNGWNWDVMSDAKDVQTLNDTALESLARAYAGYATGFFSNQFGFHFINNDADREILNPDREISKNRTEKFDFYHRKALECYEFLGKKYPGYSTSIGDISTKIANETFTGYFQLTLAGDSIRAKYYLDKCQFPDSILSKAKSFLEDAPPNSILFTAGDSHTYGIWYLQAKEGFRRDVKAINFDLLALQRYVKFIDDWNGEKFFTTSPSWYMNDTMLVLLQDEKKSENPIESIHFFQQIKFPDSEPESDKPYNSYARFPGTSIHFPCFMKGMDNQDALKLSIALKEYFFLNDYLLFDIIHTHCKRTKIVFTYWIEDFVDLLVQNNSLYLLDTK